MLLGENGMELKISFFEKLRDLPRYIQGFPSWVPNIGYVPVHGMSTPAISIFLFPQLWDFLNWKALIAKLN